MKAFAPRGVGVLGVLLAVAGLAVVLEWRQGSIEPAGFAAGALAFAAAVFILTRAGDDSRPGRRAAALAALVLSTHLLVLSSGRGDSALYSVYFVPIIVAARLGGLRASAAVGAVVICLYATFFLHAGIEEVMAEFLEETVTFLFVALLAGVLVDRLADEQARRIEAERRERERERLAEVGLLAAQIAHEFRNPLQVISGAAETVASRGWVAAPGAPLLEDLRREAGRMASLVADFLTYGRTVVRPRSGVRLEEVVARAAARVGSGVGVEGAAPLVEADPDALERALFNLFTNARRAGARSVTVRLSADGAVARVEVEDDGAGVPASLRESLFQPFRTGRPGGVGLGLAIVRRIIEAHGGEVAYAGPGAGGAGAIFRVALPRSAGAAP